jgi:hypothetical protein
MRIESSVTSLSWIPSEAVPGLNKVVFGSGFTHYDPPPPDHIDDLEALRDGDRFRFANHLSAWIEVVDGRIVDSGQGGGGSMGATTLSVGSRQVTYAAVAFPDLVPEPRVDDRSARFVQTVGGHTAVPAPRRLRRPPFVAFQAPTVWTTLALTLHADGRSEAELVGASPFPRHWVYDETHTLHAKAGLADFKDWWRNSYGDNTPWGDVDSPALVTEVESALEREVAGRIMRGGGRPGIRRVRAEDLLVEQGSEGDELFLLLDGVLRVEVDGEPLAEVGPGAILGERAVLEGGRRTATLRAATAAKLAVVPAEQVDPDALVTISGGHCREHARPGDAGPEPDGTAAP